MTVSAPSKKIQFSSDDTEKALIGACIGSPEYVPTIVNSLMAENFFGQRCKDIFLALKSLYAKGKPTDPLSISIELKAHGKDIQPSEIIELEDLYFDGLPLDYHIRQLKAFSSRRKLKMTLEEILPKVDDPSVEHSELVNTFQEIPALLEAGFSNMDIHSSLPTFSDIYDLRLEVEWVIDKLIPKQAVTVLHGPGGLGKTWLLLQMGSCISDGKPFCGFSTIKTEVYYVDYENPMAELVHRARVLGRSSLRLWHLSHNPPPPMLDTERWVDFRSLPPGVIIFDSMRSAHLLDENSSRDMTVIMSRLKELREAGHTIIVLLHSPKGDRSTYRGSTAIIDQCDHALGFERVKAVGSDSAADGESEEDLPFRLGHIQKTRFTPFKTYLKFDPEKGFSSAPNPEKKSLESVRLILLNLYQGSGPPTQTKFADAVKAELGCSKEKVLSLINKGDGTFWHGIPERKFNRITYTPVFYEDDTHI